MSICACGGFSGKSLDSITECRYRSFAMKCMWQLIQDEEAMTKPLKAAITTVLNDAFQTQHNRTTMSKEIECKQA